MKIAIYSAQPYDIRFMNEALQHRYAAGTVELLYHSESLSRQSVALAQGCEAVCVFVNDVLDAEVLEALHGLGVRAVLLRCACV